jgi:hypothetical protein
MSSNFKILQDCVFGGDFWYSFTIKNLTPVFALLAIFFISGSILSVRNVIARSKRLKKSVQSEASSIQKGFSLFLMLMSSLYTFVLSNSLSAFRCYAQNDGSSTLIGSPDLDCYDSEWMSHIFVIIFGIFVAISIPVYVSWILFSYRAMQR